MKTTLLPYLLLFIILNGTAQVWQAYEPALPEVVGTFDLRIAPGHSI